MTLSCIHAYFVIYPGKHYVMMATHESTVQISMRSISKRHCNNEYNISTDMDTNPAKFRYIASLIISTMELDFQMVIPYDLHSIIAN